MDGSETVVNHAAGAERVKTFTNDSEYDGYGHFFAIQQPTRASRLIVRKLLRKIESMYSQELIGPFVKQYYSNGEDIMNPTHRISGAGTSRRERTARKPAGFTLVQIMLVMGLLAILSAIFLGVLGRGRATARRAECDAHLKEIAMGLDTYR